VLAFVCYDVVMIDVLCCVVSQ